MHRVLPLVGALIVALHCVAVLANESLAPHLARINAVGPMGRGNAEAQSAWKVVAQAPASDLPAILAAMNDDAPLAANWLRAAIDTIAERTLAGGKSLPASELEAFTLDARHSPGARRLAYEWLFRVDPTAEARLLSEFLNDPSIELRRDAVDVVIREAEAHVATGRNEEADVAYERAFAAARDKDQVEALAKILEERGQKPDLARHFGFVTRWRVIGPFENAAGVGFNAVYPPETKLDFAGEYEGKDGKKLRWNEHETTDPLGNVDFNKTLGKSMGAAAYAHAVIDVDPHTHASRGQQLRLTCVQAYKVWLNGELIGERNVYHSGFDFDQYVFSVTLKPGRNEILVKVLQNEQEDWWSQMWEFKLRVCDSVGTPILASE